jgi:hypothetical protein
MSLLDLLMKLEALGVLVMVDGANALTARPGSALNGELRQALKDHHPALLALAKRAEDADQPGDLLGVATPTEVGFPPDPEAPGMAKLPASALDALGAEVCIKSPTMGEVWLVPAPTGAPRLEVTTKLLDLITRVASTFPSAKVTALRMPFPTAVEAAITQVASSERPSANDTEPETEVA